MGNERELDSKEEEPERLSLVDAVVFDALMDTWK